MNMHCLVAVARCRVQTRRYHCLINHIQSHRLTLCPPPSLPPFRSTRVPRSPLSSPLSRRGPAVSSLRALRAFSLIVLSHSLLSSLHPAVHSSAVTPLANWPQLTLIYVIFSGRPHVTALQRTLNQACPMRGDAVVMGEGSERKGANEDKRGRSVESPNGHPWSPRGDIRNVNRTNQSGTRLAAKLSGRVRRFSCLTGDEDVPCESESLYRRSSENCHSFVRDRYYEGM